MNELDGRNLQDLENAFSLARNFVSKEYVNELSKQAILPVPEHIEQLSIQQNIRLLKVERIVYDKEESNLDKIKSVFNGIGSINSSLIMILDSDGDRTDLYLGVRTNNPNQHINVAKEVLEKSFRGNFPGSNVENMTNNKIAAVMEHIFQTNMPGMDKTISSVSTIPSLKTGEKDNFIQGLEKLTEAMKGEKFTALLIADAIHTNDISLMKQGYERLYSQLVPFSKTDVSFGENENLTVTEGISQGFTETVNESLSKATSYTDGESKQEGTSTSKSSTRDPAAILGVIGTIGGSMIGGPAGAVIGGSVGGLAAGIIGNKSEGNTENASASTNTTVTEGETGTTGTSESKSLTENQSESTATGSSRTLQIKFENKSVLNLLEQIDDQLIRLKESEDLGLWNCACYFIADDIQISKIAASTFNALLRGENSSVENSYINTWDNTNKDNLEKFEEYLKKFSHPLIDLQVEHGLSAPYVSPGSLMNGNELPIAISLPQKSVKGIPVLEVAEFGRDVITYKEGIDELGKRFELGNIFHMGQAEQSRVPIDIESLSMHTFVTGSTGAGKSNVIYKMLDELDEKDIRFLVIEPAKGEYKHVLGGREDVHVLGTNINHSELLKINPFTFPNSVHVLEHIDRLVEIFNACWPMYAAMPAVLKDAIERTYESCGWDLEDSFNYFNEPFYPTFEDLLQILPVVINESGYSEELKSNYTGALVTRVKSLTNGLVGKIFTRDEIDNTTLFDQNCIVDISRIGSQETKSLIMGILFIRLQEHRIHHATDMNEPLKHVTVLEEAHHLLRRTSTVQSEEGGNLQGKSVEMIANAIAEMRTYGEGFIIADQSPKLLDPSAIRNTNTKIIFRLPDGDERHEIGSAASLNEHQINEIPKLRTGVAVIYQNNWLQPVLCAIDRFTKENPYQYQYDMKKKQEQNKENVSDIMKILLSQRVPEESRFNLEKIDVERLTKWMITQPINSLYKNMVIEDLKRFEKGEPLQLDRESSFETLTQVSASMINFSKLMKFANKTTDLIEWNQKIMTALRHYVDFNNNVDYEISLTQCLIREKYRQNVEYENFYFAWVERVEKDWRYMF